MKTMICPSILSGSILRVEDTIRLFERIGTGAIHVDVMDGVFVPNLALGINFIREVGAITSIPLDIHLMIMDPDRKLDWFPLREGDWVSVHPEACHHTQRVLTAIRERRCRAGVALNPATPLNALDYLWDEIDFVCLMAVNPGFAGQPLINSIFQKTRDLKALAAAHGKPDLDIEIDGHVTFENAPEMVRCGATVLVGGTGCVYRKGSTTEENIRKLKEVLK